MKLSEAIRLGSTMRPQIFNATLRREGACALGAAALALGCDEYTVGRFSFSGTFPILKQLTSFQLGKETMQVIIIKLNDNERWTREKIADWVELEEVAFLGKETAPEEMPDPIPTPEEEPVEAA